MIGRRLRESDWGLEPNNTQVAALTDHEIESRLNCSRDGRRSPARLAKQIDVKTVYSTCQPELEQDTAPTEILSVQIIPV